MRRKAGVIRSRWVEKHRGQGSRVSELIAQKCLFRRSEAYFSDVASDGMITTLKGNFGYITTRSFPPVEIVVQDDGSVIGKQ